MPMDLPMSKRHIEEMGGDIFVQSEEGEGTTVRISVSV